jgi:hypothetical protein
MRPQTRDKTLTTE